ncbi:unnamed protein product [Acanthoscelides obtectus]|uniref:CHK kinase-like domain-containing protein n=1 Tax=Acanthoscelides obtectus TaxID=200917 RepID=A0A9P0LYX3_ACAOB|nr:unnamed protein product [Acanthoscelides obtectus]CAK1621426.1 hypothetical protein AOBTE_LOCUS946 [Acanthoscelides obtectus]
MADAPKIEKIEDLVSQYIDKHKKIIKTSISRLTQPGDNYGSEMMRVDMVLKDEKSKEEELHVVAKMIPESDFFKEIFNVQVSFVSEMRFYDTVVPVLEDFRRRQGAKVKDIYPKFYGGRKNLNGMEGPVDANAVLLMDNIKTKGFGNLDRHKGFDMKSTKAILEVIAYFHATPLALKLMEPETFEKKVKPHLACFLEHKKPEKDDNFEENYVSFISECKECAPALPMVKKCIEKSEYMKVENFREPFSTIVHKDIWVNNIMVKFCESDVNIKLVDFQFYSYDSPVDDLMFFLMTSVPLDLLKSHLDDFLQCYHKCFIQVLEELKCSTVGFGYDKFIEEIKENIENIVVHSLWFLPMVIFTEKGKKADIENNKIQVSPLAKEKILWMVQEFYERGWFDKLR